MERMATPGGLEAAALIDRLFARPGAFEAGQVVRILERAGGGPAALRFRGNPSLACPEGGVAAIARPDPAAHLYEITINYLTLAGANGPLPPPLTEELNARIRRRDHTLQDFLDLFHNRFGHLAVQSAKLFRPELSDAPPSRSPLATPMLALMGLGAPGAADRAIPRPDTLMPLTALLYRETPSAHGLERGVAAWMGLPARVRQFRGAWLTLTSDQRTRIGRFGSNARLGRTATLGRRVWDQSAGIRLELGPMPLPQAAALLPGRRRCRELAGLVDRLVDGEVEVALRLRIDPSTIDDARLSAKRPSRLGWTSYLRAAPGGARPAKAGAHIDLSPDWMRGRRP